MNDTPDATDDREALESPTPAEFVIYPPADVETVVSTSSVEPGDATPAGTPAASAPGITAREADRLENATILANQVLRHLDERLAPLAHLEPLRMRLEHLLTTLDREARAEATREKVVDRLHAELQEYKNDLLLKLMRPIFTDLIQLHDDISKMVAGFDASAESSGRVLTALRGIPQDIEDILYRQGVEPFEVEGDVFDPTRQRAILTVPTDNPSDNRRVAQRLRKGFRTPDRVIRPELVAVFATTSRPTTGSEPAR